MAHIKQKMTAHLLTTFLQTAINDQYKNELYHRSLYEYYVKSAGLIKPPLPPYYRKSFFEEIKDAEKRGYKVSELKVKHWYEILIEK